MKRPVVLTSGDPCGIGPEITASAWKILRKTCPFFMVTDANHIKNTIDVPIHIITDPIQVADVFEKALPVFDLPFKHKPIPGHSQPENAPFIIQSIEKAVDFVKSNMASALCTNPINKKVLKDGADFPFPGHTEFLGQLSNTPCPVMMLTTPELRVVPVTVHIALSSVPSMLTGTLITNTIKIVYSTLQRDFGCHNPVLAVAGLNPHAGEGGLMGHEETEFLYPLLKELGQSGLNIIGPMPADTMFHAAARKTYDAAICMYHDQALIPLKTLNFSEGVNCTLGLPFIRTSPDHGTAFDIAGQGCADPTSLIRAIEHAQRLASNRAKYDATS